MVPDFGLDERNGLLYSHKNTALSHLDLKISITTFILLLHKEPIPAEL